MEFRGTSERDILDGSNEDDLFYGFAGNDVINGNGGDDVLNGGSGNDRLTGGAGNDILNGGAGDDTLIYTLNGNDRMMGAAGNDRFDIGNITDGANPTIRAFGFTGNDTLSFIDNAQVNLTFVGGDGDDTASLFSLNTNSVFNLIMGSGNDVITVGNATVSSNIRGDFTFSLGDGQDQIVFNDLPELTTITDFQTGQDSLFFSEGLFADFNEFISQAEQIGDDVSITASDGSIILLEDTLIDDLIASDFLF